MSKLAKLFGKMEPPQVRTCPELTMKGFLGLAWHKFNSDPDKPSKGGNPNAGILAPPPTSKAKEKGKKKSAATTKTPRNRSKVANANNFNTNNSDLQSSLPPKRLKTEPNTAKAEPRNDHDSEKSGDQSGHMDVDNTTSSPDFSSLVNIDDPPLGHGGLGEYMGKPANMGMTNLSGTLTGYLPDINNMDTYHDQGLSTTYEPDNDGAYMDPNHANLMTEAPYYGQPPHSNFGGLDGAYDQQGNACFTIKELFSEAYTRKAED